MNSLPGKKNPGEGLEFHVQSWNSFNTDLVP